MATNGQKAIKNIVKELDRYQIELNDFLLIIKTNEDVFRQWRRTDNKFTEIETEVQEQISNYINELKVRITGKQITEDDRKDFETYKEMLINKNKKIVSLFQQTEEYQIYIKLKTEYGHIVPKYYIKNIFDIAEKNDIILRMM